MSDDLKISPLKACGWIFLSLILISGSFSVGILYYRSHQKARFHDQSYNITALVQSCKGAEPLKTACVAEILQLSADVPVNLYAFDVVKAQSKILGFSIIKKAVVKKIPPNMLYVEYSLRVPIAYVSDYNNAFIDAEGVLAPFNPYYTPKNIPSIYFGFEKDLAWGEKVEEEKLQLALKVLKILQKTYVSEEISVESVDVSHAFSSNYGAREFTVTLSKKIDCFVGSEKTQKQQSRILRLTAENYLQQLANYQSLSFYIDKDAELCKEGKASFVVIDMRVSKTAFISYHSSNFLMPAFL